VAKKAGIRYLIRERNTLLFKLACHGFSPVTDARYYDGPQRHVENMAAAFGREVPFSDYNFDPGIPDSELALRPKIQSQMPTGPYIVVNPDTHSCKRFDPQAMHIIVTELISAGQSVVVVGLKDPTGISAHPNVISLIGQTTLLEVFGLIRSAKGFIGFDSGTSHVATAYGTPAITLFPPKGARISLCGQLRSNHPYKYSPAQSNCKIHCRHYPSCALKDCEHDYDEGALRKMVSDLVENKNRLTSLHHLTGILFIGATPPEVEWMANSISVPSPSLRALPGLLQKNQISIIHYVGKRAPVRLLLFQLFCKIKGRFPFRLIVSPKISSTRIEFIDRYIPHLRHWVSNNGG